MSETPKQLPGGLVVFFEGIDGAGKTTQLQQARQWLEADGWSVQGTRSHGGTPIGEALREVSLSDTPRPVGTDFHLSLAIHAALAEQVAAWRQAGNIILIDRGPLSIIAYQVYGDGLAAKEGWSAVARDLGQFAAEEIIVYAATVEIALQRARRKPGASDYFESKPLEYFEKTQAGYLEAAERYGAVVIDANQSIAAVQAETKATIEQAIANRLRFNP